VGICVIPNIAIGEIPATPKSDKEVQLPEIEKTMREYAAHYGSPFGYIQEQGDTVFQQIVPVKNLESVQISSSSVTELDLHTETAFHPYPPDYVFLLCLRGDSKAFTTYANLDVVLKKLSKTTQKVLRQPWFTTRIDESFVLKGQQDKSFDIPILQGDNQNTRIVYDKFFMRATSTAGRTALEELNQAIKSSVKKVALKSGELMIIDNRKTVHGRLPFTPRYDGTDRWLMRTLVMKKLPSIENMSGEIVTTVL
jgi:L-asparagine oxygenase